MNGRALGFLCLLSAVGLVGCGGSAVLISRNAQGGVLGIDGDREDAMADARRQMSEYCGGAYTITSEGTPAGQEGTRNQIRYACGAAPDGQNKPAQKAP